jgi:predicted transcriptional regulator
MKQSEILAIRIDSDLLDYLRQLAQRESRTMAKQVNQLIANHKSRAESIARIQKQNGIMPKGK